LSFVGEVVKEIVELIILSRSQVAESQIILETRGRQSRDERRGIEGLLPILAEPGVRIHSTS
jgi:hypothetical protein